MYPSLDRIKRILGFIDETKDSILNDFIEMYSNAIIVKCGATEFPTEMNFVLVDAVIARYNKIGSEGLKSENIDVVSMTYHDDILSPYDSYFVEYKKRIQVELIPTPLPMVRFL